MKPLKALLITIFLVNTNIYAEIAGSGSTKTWLSNIGTDLDINSFVKSIKFDTKLKTCGHDFQKDSIFGIVMHHNDLFIFTETVREKGYVIFMESNILDKKNKKVAGLGKIIGMGDNRNKKQKQYVNMVELPIISMITDSLGMDGIACFHPKNKFFFYSSSIDPTAVDYMQYYALLDAVSMFNINGILAMVLDCVSYEGYKLVNKFGGSAKYFSRIIDSYPHSFGCNGGVTLGSHNQSPSPLVNGLLQSATVLKIMSLTGYSIMQSKRSLLNIPGKDVTCQQEKGPFIKTEFLPQMLLPVSSKTFELGETPAEWAAFKDNQKTRGDTAIAWWVRKDFTAFAGHCVW